MGLNLLEGWLDNGGLQAIIGMIAKTKPSSNGARVVGVYGIGGIGKTTFCKELCYQLYKRFDGKVCHAELGSKSETELQKEVVQKLTNVNHGSCSLADDLKVTNLSLAGW
jgi:Ni2+-binding GTPase involved in maturation of urease and hydrogenase